MRGVVLCSLSDDDTCCQTGDDGERETNPVLDTQEIEYAEGGNGDEHGADVCAKWQRTKQILHRSTFLRTNEENTK